MSSNKRELEKVKAHVKELEAFIGVDVPDIIGVEAVEFARDNFQKQGFEDQKWKSRADKKPHKILVKTDNLRESIDYTASKHKVAITSDVAYAPVHNEGLSSGRKSHPFEMPQRQFIGASETLNKNINDKIEQTFKTKIKS